MDKAYVEEHDIAGKYLRGELTSEEMESFELLFMEDQEMLERLEIDTVLFQHAARAHEQINNAGKNKKWSSFIQLACGMAAGILIMVFVPQMMKNNDDMLDKLGIAQIEYIDDLRSPGPGRVPTKVIELNSSAESLVIVIDTGKIGNISYDIVVNRNSGNQQVVSSAIDVPGSVTGELEIYIPVKLLVEDVYVLNLYESGTHTLVKAYFLDIIL